MQFQNTHRQALLALTASLACAGTASAAAFQLKEQSAAGQGRAFAGSISQEGDATVVANNPAAMTLLNGSLLQTDLAVIDYSVKFSGTGKDALGRPLAGGNGGDAGDTAPVPSLYFHTPLTDQVHLGLFITAPFGFKTEYADGWIGRYNGIKTELKAVDMGAAGAYRVNDMLSLGASLFVERLDVKLRNAVDFGAMLAGARVPGFLPGSADGSIDINGHHTALGYTLGALLRPSEGLSVGLAYRSEVRHKPDDVGVNFSVPGSADAVLSAVQPNTFVNTTARTELILPSSWTVSASQQLNERWTVMADYAHTAWSRFNNVVLDFDSQLPNETLRFGYRNTSFYSVGAEYKADDSWILRGGIGYDQTPVTNALRDVRVPDVDRRWLSLGATWRASKRMSYSLGYTHLFLKDAAVNLTSPTASTLQGSYKLGSNILAVSAQYAWMP